MAPFEHYTIKCKSSSYWIEVGEAELTRPDIVQEIVEKIKVIKDKLKIAQDRQLDRQKSLVEATALARWKSVIVYFVPLQIIGYLYVDSMLQFWL